MMFLMFLHPRLNVEKRMVLAACLDGIMAPGLVRGCQYAILPTGSKSTNLGPEREQQFKCCFANCKLPVTSEWNVVYAFKFAGNNVRLLESFQEVGGPLGQAFSWMEMPSPPN